MQLNHQFVVPATVEQTWEAFNDLELIAPCFPGASLGEVDGDEFTGSVKVKLGPISLQYNGSGRFAERDETGRRAVIEAKGKDKRGNGTAAATVTAVLTPDAAGTEVSVDTDLSITGKPAQFGRGVIQDVSDKLLGQFVDCIAGKLGDAVAAEQVEETGGAPAAEPAAAPAAAPETDAPPATGTDDAATGTASEPEPAAELNLMSTIAPVVAKRAAPYVIAAVVTLILYKLIRRRGGGTC